jgi:ArsR family transcriptional regulator
VLIPRQGDRTRRRPRYTACVYSFIWQNVYFTAFLVHSTFQREVHRLHAEICQALSDPSRILILYELHAGARNVGELAGSLGLSQPTVSRHLKVLRDRKMVRAEREGTSVYYTLADARVVEALNLLRAVLAGILDQRTALAEELEPT